MVPQVLICLIVLYTMDSAIQPFEQLGPGAISQLSKSG